MSLVEFNEDQSDALAEVVNIAMGQAGSSLARVLDAFVELSVPRIRVVAPDQALAALRELAGDEPVSAVRQAFFSQLRGEAIALFSPRGCEAVAGLLGYAGEGPDELVLDVANLLNGAWLCGIASQLSYDLSFCPPVVIARHAPIDRVFEWGGGVRWTHTLLVEVCFRISDLAFKSHVLVFWPDDAIEKLRRAVDKLMEDLGCQ